MWPLGMAAVSALGGLAFTMSSEIETIFWGGGWILQVAKQLEIEKQQIIDRKRREQSELKRKQEELDRILRDNKRKVLLPICILLYSKAYLLVCCCCVAGVGGHILYGNL